MNEPVSTSLLFTIDQNLTLVWLALGALLLASELFVPSLIVGFFGVGAFIVASSVAIGWVSGFEESIYLWLGASAALLLGLRSAFNKLARGDKETVEIDEDHEAVGEIVEVVEVEADAPDRGRVKFRGTTWEAESDGTPLVVGARVRLMSRDNLRWYVETDIPGLCATNPKKD